MNKFQISCIEPHKFASITELCKNITVPGSVIEVGVLNGGMGLHLAEILPDRKIYLCDTFTGIPYTSFQDNWFTKGYFSGVKVEEVREKFAPFPNVIVLQGLFPDNFVEMFDKEIFAVVHLDVDVYKSYKDGLGFLYPRTAQGGIIFLDDYKCTVCEGCTIACDEFMQTVPEEIKVYNNQYYFIKGNT